MINLEVLSGISYGLFIVSSGNKDMSNGFISNTVFQVTSQPKLFAIGCSKENFTAEFIIKSGSMVVTVLEVNTPMDMFSKFGYKSGRDINKMAGWNIRYSELGIPIVLNHAVSYLELTLQKTIDVGSHWLFIGLLQNAEKLNSFYQPITYEYYTKVKKGISPKNSPTYIEEEKFDYIREKSETDQYKCSVCGYIYDEAENDIKFADLPDDWACPLCGAGKEEFR
jgi:flavin reductase (DIM6/NTAB) family NADH-FMN oxidoreductase RutF/rubredoxin